MTKSQRSATKKLPLVKLFRWLAVLCFIKLSIFTMILLDVPFISFFDTAIENKHTDEEKVPETQKSAVESAANIPPIDIPVEKHDISPKTEQTNILNPEKSEPEAAPIIHDKSSKPLLAGHIEEKKETEKALLSGHNLPLPPPLPAPIAEPGTPAPSSTLLAEEKISVPTLGSVTAAKAAQSMPLPKAGPSTSPFAPIEQSAPLTHPGVPDIPRDGPGASSPGAPQAGGQTGMGRPSMPAPGQGPGTSSRDIPDLQGKPLASPPIPRDVSPQNSANGIQMNTEAQELARQQQDMLMLKKQMDERMKELEDSEAKVKRMLEEARNMEDKKIRTLIQMYANMKPKTAAKALESMDERTACQILQRMTPKQSGDILSYTNPKVTAKLTELLARMRMQ
ncbi:MAG: hypothetical protein K5657_04075 [Desulfovibrio sp.]|nr:hypothetical protein [Desulfovibrio sp.]